MNRRRLLVVLLGLAVVATGVAFGADRQATWSWSSGVAFGVFLIALVALAIGLLKIRGSLDTTADAPAVPWAPDEPFANPTPERSDRGPRLSSDAFARVIETAGATARDAGTVDEGLAVVRPALRETLLEALEGGGRSRSEAEAALATGAWTDDRVAASVLDETIRPPDLPFRERVHAWLYPERVVRQRSRRAMAAVADAADDALPAVPGQTAPRTVPVLRPRLEELSRGADGRLQRAVDPTAIARGPRPPAPRLTSDEPAADGSSEQRREPTEETDS